MELQEFYGESVRGVSVSGSQYCKYDVTSVVASRGISGRDGKRIRINRKNRGKKGDQK